MIKSIKLVNFKCFRSLELGMSSLNVFAGMNGAGKSSVIQSLLAMRQSWESKTLQSGQIQLNGKLIELGTAKEIYCAEPNSGFIELCFVSTKLGRDLPVKCQAEVQPNGYVLQIEKAWGSTEDGFELFGEPFNYLNAERIGPRKTMQIPPDDGHRYWVGKYGENSAHIVASLELRNRQVHPALTLQSEDEKTYPFLHYQWELWMNRLFPGFSADSEVYTMADQVRLGLALQRKTGQSLFVRPPNTGFGLSYILGVVVAGLVAAPETVLIVENPEAHLHPKAQSGIGEFLGRVAASGAQVFVETHSEHVLNGMRRVVKQRSLTPDKIRVHFFANQRDSIEPSVTTIKVSPTGDIAHWPEGFFDQLDQDLSIILG